MAYSALEAAWAKYNKAVRELGALRANVERFLERGPYTVEVGFEADSGWWVARTKILEEPPAVLGVQVGCIAHEAFSALNHVTWALGVRKLGERNASKWRYRRHLDFPVFERESEFRGAKVLGFVSQPASKAFEELQPFHRPPGEHGRIQHPLLLVKELANADKHRVLAPSYGTVQLGPVLRGEAFTYDESVASGPEFRRVLTTRAKRRMITSGTALARVRFEDGNARADVRLTDVPAAEVVFESDTWAGVNLLSIGGCVATVDRCLTRLARLFPRESWPPTTHDPAAPYQW